MTWLWIVLAVAVLGVGVLLLRRRGGRNSGAPAARDAGRSDATQLDAHVARTQHHGNIYGSGGGGLPM